MDKRSFWLNEYKDFRLHQLDHDTKHDIAIIGGGITGLTTALLLYESGQNPAVFEANKIGHGASCNTTAKVTIQHGLIYHKLIKNNGIETAKDYLYANNAAIIEIERIINQYKIDCDYEKTSSSVIAFDEKSSDNIIEEYDALKKLDVDVSYNKKADLSISNFGLITINNQGMFHPVKYINGLLGILKEKHIPIYIDTRITEVDKDNTYILKTQNGKNITANKIIIATKYPILNKKNLLFTKLESNRSYAIACEMPNFDPQGYYISCEKDVRSIRSYEAEERKLVIIAGANHQTGECENTEQLYKDLVDFATILDNNTNVIAMWSTQDCMTLDHIPYIGELTKSMPNIYVATGFNKWGMTQSMVASTLITQQINGIKLDWHSIYRPERALNLPAAKELFVQGTNVVRDYMNTFFYNGLEKYDQIETGCSGIIDFAKSKIGVYKDDDGNVHLVSAKCPHMGCLLTFNKAEKTWDCPCHGSRFTYKGEVIEAPSVKEIGIHEKEIESK